MAYAADLILARLGEVDRERKIRAADPGLALKVQAVKSFQHRRFAWTYADLLAEPGYRAAARFFLDELYGPADFTQRDHQFGRMVPALTSLFSKELVCTVSLLSELHALSESLDTRMGRSLSGESVGPLQYMLAWCDVAEPDLRERQIELTAHLGRALERHTRSRLLRTALHTMRRPARMAGLGELQCFLEGGFDTFQDMPDPEWFLGEVCRRERKLVRQLFAKDYSDLEGVQ